MIQPDQTVRVLSEGFYSACDPALSFDANRLLFAGKRGPEEAWNIFELNLDDGSIRQVTHGAGDCRLPGYQSTLYTIVSSQPWYQLTYVAMETDGLNEAGGGITGHLYSCKLDGSATRRLTHNLSSDCYPAIMPDGRLVYAAWQRSNLRYGPLGRMGLFHVSIDGTDNAAFSVEEGMPYKRMPCVSAGGLVVFVESDRFPDRETGGRLGTVTLRRPLHSYRPVPNTDEGLFAWPAPLPDGRILVSHQPQGSDPYGLVLLDPVTGDRVPLFDDRTYHDMQAHAVVARPEPDGRSSVVSERDPYGKLYCLNVYINDLEPNALPPGDVKRLRVLEGIPLRSSDVMTQRRIRQGAGPLAQRRILGEVDVAIDGSFNVEIPAGIPVELQLLDEDGLALRRCSWIWAMNHEPRGCIGCHEDNELTPENHMVDALKGPSMSLTLPPERRRTVDFRRDVVPILKSHCSRCHAQRLPRLEFTDSDPTAESEPWDAAYRSLLSKDKDGHYRFVQPGQARLSRLIWAILGRMTARPWDDAVADTADAPKRMPPDGAALSDLDKRILIEWIDLGASWDGLAGLK
jgi:hypothetical protein